MSDLYDIEALEVAAADATARSWDADSFAREARIAADKAAADMWEARARWREACNRCCELGMEGWL